MSRRRRKMRRMSRRRRAKEEYQRGGPMKSRSEGKGRRMLTHSCISMRWQVPLFDFSNRSPVRVSRADCLRSVLTRSVDGLLIRGVVQGLQAGWTLQR